MTQSTRTFSDLDFKMKTTQRFRLLGADTPERGQPNYREAREMAESPCPPGTELLFESMKSDKYGRWLVHIDPSLRCAAVVRAGCSNSRFVVLRSVTRDLFVVVFSCSISTNHKEAR